MKEYPLCLDFNDPILVSDSNFVVDRQLLCSSLQYSLLHACLRFGWTACVAAFLFVLFRLPVNRLLVEGTGVGLFACTILLLRYFVLPRINRVEQLDFVSLAFITPILFLCCTAILSTTAESCLPAVVLINTLGAVLFYRDLFYWVWYMSFVTLYALCQVLSGIPMTEFGWVTLLVILPAISLIMRSTLSSFLMKLDKNGKEPQELKTLQLQSEFETNSAPLHAVLASAPLFLWCIDRDQKITDIKGDVLQNKLGDLSNSIGKKYDSVFGFCEEVVEAIELTRIEMRPQSLRSNFSEGRVVELRIEPMFDPNGELAGMIGVGIDVTESAQSDQRKMELQKSLFHVQKMESLGLLAGGVAHDFNNYLMAIIAFADSLDCREDGLVNKIKDTALRASGVCEQLLVYSGNPADQKSKMELVDLNELILDTEPLVQAIVPKEIGISFQVEESVALVNVNRGQIHQIAINMIKNSVEAIGNSCGGEIAIKVISRYSKSEAAQVFGEFDLSTAYCAFEIRDNGCGISSDDLERIVDLYFTTKIDGHGFGMAVASRMIQDHAGCLEVERLSGLGTVFRVILPINPNSPCIEFQTGIERPELYAETSFSGFHVLLVDDEPAVLEAMQMVLQSCGHEVTTADSAIKALDIIKELDEEIDCIVSDYAMPLLNGLRFGEKIRQIGFSQPFVLCSGYSQIEEKEAGEFVPDTFLFKPFEPQTLDEAIFELCETSSELPNPWTRANGKSICR